MLALLRHTCNPIRVRRVSLGSFNRPHRSDVDVDKVLIEGLKVSAVIGVFDWERQIRQPLVLDIALSVDLRQAAATDDLRYAVNYKSVADRVCDEIERLQPQLIETLADCLAAMMLQEFDLVQQVALTIRKPLALVNVQSVAVSIERSRDDLRALHRD
jgi:dihydroneopterin aldolase